MEHNHQLQHGHNSSDWRITKTHLRESKWSKGQRWAVNTFKCLFSDYIPSYYVWHCVHLIFHANEEKCLCDISRWRRIYGENDKRSVVTPSNGYLCSHFPKRICYRFSVQSVPNVTELFVPCVQQQLSFLSPLRWDRNIFQCDAGRRIPLSEWPLMFASFVKIVQSVHSCNCFPEIK